MDEKSLKTSDPGHLICAGFQIGRQGSCKGDSGGPLQYQDILGFYMIFLCTLTCYCSKTAQSIMTQSKAESKVLNRIVKNLQQCILLNVILLINVEPFFQFKNCIFIIAHKHRKHFTFNLWWSVFSPKWVFTEVCFHRSGFSPKWVFTKCPYKAPIHRTSFSPKRRVFTDSISSPNGHWYYRFIGRIYSIPKLVSDLL